MSDMDVTPADIKAALAEHGQTLHPEAKMTLRARPKPGESAQLVVLERVAKGVTPDYCTHGYASCVVCEAYCWIGHATEKVLVAGEAFGICRECAAKHIPPDTKPIGHLHDHRRQDGPHA